MFCTQKKEIVIDLLYIKGKIIMDESMEALNENGVL